MESNAESIMDIEFLQQSGERVKKSEHRTHKFWKLSNAAGGGNSGFSILTTSRTWGGVMSHMMKTTMSNTISPTQTSRQIFPALLKPLFPPLLVGLGGRSSYSSSLSEVGRTGGIDNFHKGIGMNFRQEEGG